MNNFASKLAGVLVFVLTGVSLLYCQAPNSQAPNSPAPNVVELKQTAATGDIEAQLRLAKCYEQGTGVDQDDALAAEWYRKAAEYGNPQAQSQLGFMYRAGRGVELDKQVAVQWWSKAAAQGYVPSFFNMGTAYFNGDGVGIDDYLAYAWFSLSAAAADSRGQEAVLRMESEHTPAWLGLARFKLAEKVEKGQGVPANQASAKSFYERVLQTDTPEGALKADAHMRIAQMFADGRGVNRSLASARQECEAAATLGSTKGVLCLGKLAETDAFGAPDYKLAAHYYEQVVKMADTSSMIPLGRLYENGLGVKEDKLKALTMYFIGEARLNPVHPLASELLAAKLKPGDVKKAAKKAKEWKVVERKLP